MKQLTIQTTAKRQIIDITDQVAAELPHGSGLVHVFIQHTTAAVTTADLDPGTDLDFLDFLDGIVPHKQWRHPHDPAHAPDHLLASTIGSSVSVPYENGKLLLGVWQRLIIVELDGPRDRQIILSTI